jgi:hypothetical protein
MSYAKIAKIIWNAPTYKEFQEKLHAAYFPVPLISSPTDTLLHYYC